MFKIGKKKAAAPQKTTAEKPQKEDNAYVGAYPGKPWEKLTGVRHGRRRDVKALSKDEQAMVVMLSQKYFRYSGSNFPGARTKIQEELDKHHSNVTDLFFATAIFTEKRLVVRAYLSNADGRFIDHDTSIKLLKYFAEAGLDFEIGAIDYYIDNARKTELVVGDGTEIISENGYWYSHTHPAKTGITHNFLPSTQDLDVILITARSYAVNLGIVETEYHVLRDIGESKIVISASISDRPAQAKIDRITIEYFFKGDIDASIERHLNTLINHLRTRHGMLNDQIKFSRIG